MKQETHNFLGKQIDITRLNGYHIYATLQSIEQFGIWVTSKTETSFIAFNDIKDIRLDRKAGGF